MKTMSFNAWSKAGYLIIKGSKSVGRNENNECLFNSTQVKKKEKQPFSDKSWDSADDLNTCGGPMYGIYGNCD